MPSERPDDQDRQYRPVMGMEHGYKWLRVQNNPVFAAMVEMMDQTVGTIREALREAGIAEETIIVFYSDNGGLATDHPSTPNFPLRVGKGWMYEGGVRVPLIVYWPGVTEPGGVSDTPVTSTDFYDTIAEMTGTPVPGNQGTDGRSPVPLLRQTGTIHRDRLYWHYPHYHGAGNTPSGAVRSGPYKLVQYFATEEVELYNLYQDASEQRDVSDERPALTDSLLERLRSWRDQVGAQMPKPNPNYE
ncbi:MAG: sulfatase/phosphatase domain-containing protein [Salinibacter sp.]